MSLTPIPAAERPEHKVALSISLSAPPASLINGSRGGPHVRTCPLHESLVPGTLVPIALPIPHALIHNVAKAAPSTLGIKLSVVSAATLVEGSDKSMPRPAIVGVVMYAQQVTSFFGSFVIFWRNKHSYCVL